MKKVAPFLILLAAILGVFFFLNFAKISQAYISPTIVHWVSISDISSGWPAGETKSVTFYYTGFSGLTASSVKLSICHPTSRDVCQSWNSSAPIESLNLSGSGTKTITKATGARLYERLQQNDPALTPYFDNYQTRLKICPSRSDGDAPSVDCAISGTFAITPACGKDLFVCPDGQTVGRTGPKCEFVCPNYLSKLMISDGTETEWLQNTSKKISWQTTGSIPYVDVYVCDANKSACVYAQKNIVNTGIATVLMTKSPGSYVKILVRKPGDISSNLFSQDILVTAPIVSRLSNLVVDVGNGPESEWVQNTSKKISWQTTGTIPYVDIYICNADKSACAYAERNIANAGTATVLMTKSPGSYVKILVRKPGDISSNLFSSDFLVVGSTPPRASIGTIGGVTYDPWPAGATKRIIFTYQNFSQTTRANTVAVKICHPSEVPEVCKPGGLGLPAESLNLQGSGSYTIEKTVPSNWYQRLLQEDLSLLRYANVYRGEYKFKLKICPADSAGNIPTGATCGGYIIFHVVAPTSEPPEREEPPVASDPSVFAVTISDVASGWASGVTKLINFKFSDFSDNKIKVSLCHPLNSPCQNWDASVPVENFILSESGTKTITKTTGTRLYERLKQGDPTLAPYFSNYLGNYLAKIKICPVNSSGVTLSGATCGYSPTFKVMEPPDSGSGQGCFDNECVCVDGVVKRCGSPMRAGTGCSLTCGPISLSDKLLASLSFISDGVFIKLDKIFGK